MEEIRNIFQKYGLPFSRCLGSKSDYSGKNKGNLIIYNARVYDKKTFEKEKKRRIVDFFEGQKIELWYGDLDLSKDIKILHSIAKKSKLELVVCREDGEGIIEIKNKKY